VLVISGFNAVRAGIVSPLSLSLPGPPRASQYSANLYAVDLSAGRSEKVNTSEESERDGLC